MIQILFNINHNEDNLKINEIIMEYQEVISKQNNKFNFSVSNTPFELLYNFIKNILEPPLLQLKNQYDNIENRILEIMSDAINNFPDYTDLLKKKLKIDETFEYIYSLYDIIKDLLLKYGDDLDIDTNSYINKLIHYTYINGLYTYERQCNQSYCSINVDYNTSRRNLEEIKYKRYRKLSSKEYRKYDNLKINKNIDSTEIIYNEKMGSLSKDDIIKFLKETKNIINQLNKTLQTNFDNKINSKMQAYIYNINGTYLMKLKSTIRMAALKLSSILTKSACSKVESDLLKHYYKIENYINNITKYLINDTYLLLNTIKNVSDYFQEINDYTYDKILGFYDIFITLIENKYSHISEKEIKEYNKYIEQFMRRRIEEKKEEEDDEYETNEIDLKYFELFNKKFKNIQVENYKLTEKIIIGVIYPTKLEISGGLVDLIGMVKSLFKDNNKNENDKEEESNWSLSYGITLTLKNFKFDKSKLDIYYNYCYSLFSFEYPIIIYLVSFPYLQFRIIPSIDINSCLGEGFGLDFEKKNYEFYRDISIGAEASVSLEIGLYYPPFDSSFQMGFSIGIKGILGS